MIIPIITEKVPAAHFKIYPGVISIMKGIHLSNIVRYYTKCHTVTNDKSKGHHNFQAYFSYILGNKYLSSVNNNWIPLLILAA